MKNISKLSTFLYLATCLLFASCNDDNDTSTPYLRVSDVTSTSGNYVLSASEQGFNVIPDVGNSELAVVTYDLRSNRDWKVVFESGNTDDWLMAYPMEGSGDGKLRFCVKDNDAIDERTALAVLYYQDGGASDVQFVVKQEANLPYLNVSINGKVGATRSSSGRDGGIIQLIAFSNGDYLYTKSPGSSWFTLAEERKGEITVTVDPLPEDFDEDFRDGTITFKGIGSHAHLETVIRIVQSVVGFDGASQITIEELLEQYEGKFVEDNLYIRGIVVSDIDNKNIPPDQMVVQDRSGKGLLIVFDDASGNTFKVGTEVSVWVYDKEIRKATISDVGADNNIYDPTEGIGCDGVIKTISSLLGAEEHLNCLVRITNAEWVFPYGTYYPGDERTLYTSAAAVPWTDKARIVRSTGGGALRAYVLGGENEAGGATFKHARLLPKGNGSLTGIIMNRYDDFERTTDITVFRMRSGDDDEIPAEGTRGYQDIVEYVWPPFSNVGIVPVVPISGAGTLRSTMTDSWHFPNVAGEIYVGYCYWRLNDPSTPIDGAGANTYWAMNTAAMDGSQSARSIFAPNYPFSSGGINGEGWVATFSAENVTADEEIVVGFSTSSSSTGPRDFVLDWGEALYTNDAIDWPRTFAGTFTSVAQYECTNWDAQLYPPEFMFALPADCNGKANICIRLRVNGTRRANLALTTTVFAGGGTNRLCALVISKRPK